MKQPHDNWAKFYDFVYEKSFGNYYNSLTKENLKVINDILSNGSIIDFGAGVGSPFLVQIKSRHSFI
jgi:hypothetical protein